MPNLQLLASVQRDGVLVHATARTVGDRQVIFRFVFFNALQLRLLMRSEEERSIPTAS
jgi:hypothetical protein